MTAARNPDLGVWPTDAEVATKRADLANRNYAAEAYKLGWVGACLRSAAEAHERCRKAHCQVCGSLRRGLAMLYAEDPNWRRRSDDPTFFEAR